MNKFRLDETKELAIVSWAEKVSGFTAIWDKQDVYGSDLSRRPTLPYIQLNISSGPRTVGKADLRSKMELVGNDLVPVDDIFTHRFHKQFTLSVNIYARNEHLNIAEDLRDSLVKETVLADLRAAGLAVQVYTDAEDISALLETANEFRATFDILMGFSNIVEDDTGHIEDVKATGTGDLSRSFIDTTV